MLLESLRTDLVRYARKLAMSGLVRGTQGNLSARDTASGCLCVTPSATEYETLTPEDIVVLDAGGAIIEGRWKPTVETPTHLRVYRERPDVGAVIHAHAPYVTAFGVAYQPIPLVLEEAALCLGGPVPIAPYAMSGTEAFAQLVVSALGQGAAVVWGNHGLLVAGPSLKQAYAMAHACEDNAQAYLLAKQLGEPRVLPDDEVARLHRYWLEAYGQRPLPSPPT
ncbi:MAG: class II aldolase/adducin family protein [Ktedonobacterales bacterium]|nr:class II aldolase/adducin family protein [Ktedonobacterales bacterium]